MRLFFLYLLLLSLNSGCATFYDGKSFDNERKETHNSKQLYKQVDLEIIMINAGYEKKEKLNVTSLYGKKGEMKLTDKVDEICSILKSSGISKDIVIGGKKSDVKILIEYVYGGEFDRSHYAWQWLTALTVGIIPFWQKRTLTLNATITNVQGSESRTVSIKEKMLDVKHILMLPLAIFFRSDNAYQAALDLVTRKMTQKILEHSRK